MNDSTHSVRKRGLQNKNKSRLRCNELLVHLKQKILSSLIIPHLGVNCYISQADALRASCNYIKVLEQILKNNNIEIVKRDTENIRFDEFFITEFHQLQIDKFIDLYSKSKPNLCLCGKKKPKKRIVQSTQVKENSKKLEHENNISTVQCEIDSSVSQIQDHDQDEIVSTVSQQNELSPSHEVQDRNEFKDAVQTYDDISDDQQSVEVLHSQPIQINDQFILLHQIEVKF